MTIDYTNSTTDESERNKGTDTFVMTAAISPAIAF